MNTFAILCLAAVAVAKPQGFKNDAVTTVTERSYTIRGEADKYYGTNTNSGLSSGLSSYSNGLSGLAYPYSFPSSYSYSTAAPVQAYQTYFQQAPAFRAYQAPAFQGFQSYQAPAFQAPAFQAPAFQAPAFSAVTAAPAFSAVTAAPAVSYSAAPELSFETATAAPALAFPAATVAPALAFPTATVAPAVAPLVETVAAPIVSLRQDYGAQSKVYKHVYAFAAPEEPATRARVHVEAPVSSRKHYKLVFIKAPSQQSVVDSDISLPAHDEEKTLIYVLSKDQKQVQPEIRIKQAEASKHAKPEVYFLKYKTEAEAQAIASSAISGQTADVPAEGEIISDGSVSVLGQGSSYNSGFESGAASFDGAYRAQQPALFYRAGLSGQAAVPAAQISTVSTGTVGIVPVTQAPVAVVSDARDASFAGYSGGFSFGRNVESDEVSNALKATTDASDSVAVEATSTATPF